MKKKLFYLLAVFVILCQTLPIACAKTGALSNPVQVAIKKYKSGNYTGCLQDCMNIVAKDPSNAVAYYYMAISYAQAGDKDNAVNSYKTVMDLKPNAKLLEYATTGKRCLETPDQCTPTADPNADPELDKFIAAPYSDGLSDSVKKGIQKNELSKVKNDVNNGKDIDSYDLRKLDRTQADVNDKVSEKKPTNDEIVAALKVLNNAGLNPYAQTQAAVNPYYQQMNYQNPEMAQLNMFMGNSSQNGTNNGMMNMLPYMLAQSKNGSNNYSPQMMQAVIMNSMMSDMNFNTDKDK